MQKIKLLVFLALAATIAAVMYQYAPLEQYYNLRRLSHETYTKGEANYEFCMELCTSKGGVNCGGKRKGCCHANACSANKIYGWDECAKGQSVRLGTDRCIGSWD
ncbi:unnamed protein product [Paramecium octaurelia]|uniref:Uncharacterized protein n=1 Tax=Paramecium octaurelia TaxID=43137 RepID=A0A8S1WVD0_PAROT|nr:unnamed protein product [Paramecium octaurelia]